MHLRKRCITRPKRVSYEAFLRGQNPENPKLQIRCIHENSALGDRKRGSYNNFLRYTLSKNLCIEEILSRNRCIKRPEKVSYDTFLGESKSGKLEVSKNGINENSALSDREKGHMTPFWETKSGKFDVSKNRIFENATLSD